MANTKALKQALDHTKEKLAVAKKALEDIANWDDDMDDEYGDPGERANRSLEKIALMDGF